MPIMTGTIWGQNLGYRHVRSDDGIGVDRRVDDVTILLSFVDITADASFGLLEPSAKSFWAECGFIEVNSLQAGIEDHEPAIPRVARKGVGGMIFRTAVVDCQVRSRWVINYWRQEMQATQKPAEELELGTVKSFVGYDAKTGLVEYTNEILADAKPKPEHERLMDIDSVRRLTARHFTGRPFEILQAPKGFRLKPNLPYCVDLASKTIEAMQSAHTHSDFLARAVGK